jgi:hypothetical protein
VVRAHATDDARREGLSPTAWRDMIVGIHMAAADARYVDFRRSLSRQSKGSFFGLDSVALGLSSGASIAGERAANILSAGAAAVTGSRATLAKEVYFEKTLPALLAGMDAARLNVKTDILTRLRQPPETYPLSAAFTDLMRYEAAASLDSAIELVTSKAVEESDDAKERFQEEFVTTEPENGVITARLAMKARLRDLVAANDIEALNAAAKAVDLPTGTEPLAVAEPIMLLFARQHRRKDTEALVAAIEAAIAGGS